MTSIAFQAVRLGIVSILLEWKEKFIDHR